MKTPTSTYPLEEGDIFQLKIIPPIPIDRIKDGEIIIKNMFISIDATMRIWISGFKSYIDPVLPGDLMKAMCVGEVIYSKGRKCKVGDKVLGMLGWQRYSVIKEN
eukprot:GHVR01041165.1.p2 GENE.GHVR01041165.1~~GHVR01041165.1.p2  ORF type:complete len:105 (+),score=10.42 GHVR01041165.1:1346-1660(+)